MRFWGLIWVLTTALFINPTFGEQAPQFYTLSNGLRVVIIQDDHAKLATTRVIVGAGSIHEGAQLGSGMSHYLEHLLAGGTTSIRSELDYTKMIDQMGGAYNAMTSSDYTGYYITTTPKMIRKAIGVLYEWMFFSKFTKDQFQRERSVILKEMARANANVGRVFYQKAQDFFYASHPIRYPVIGYTPSFKKVGIKDLRAYYHRYYVPGNMILVVAGDLRGLDIKQVIETGFGSQSARAYPSGPRFYESPILMPRSQTVHHDVSVSRMSLRFPTIDLAHKDLYALDLLDYVLGQGSQSLLYKRLVDELGLLSSIATVSYTPLYTNGYFEIVMEGDLENFDAAQLEIWAILKKIKKGRVSRSDINRAKTQKEVENIMAVSTIEDRASRAASSVLWSQSPGFHDHYARSFSKLKKRDLIRVAKQYLLKDVMVSTTMSAPQTKNENHPQSEKLIEATPSLDVVTLASGLKIVFLPDNNSQKLMLRYETRGGLMSETPTTNGTGMLISNLFGKGSKNMSKNKIQSLLSSHGASFSSQVSRDTQSFSMISIAKDASTIVPLFLDSLVAFDIKDSDFEHEKNQLLITIKKIPENWLSQTYQAFKASVFMRHPYGYPKTGTKTSVSKLEKKFVVRAHQKRIRNTQSSVIVVSGNYDRRIIFKKIKKYFKKLDPISPTEEKVMVSKNMMLDHLFNKHRFLEAEVSQNVGVVMIGFRGVDYSDTRDIVELDLLDAALSGMRYPGGRLHPILRGKGLVYVVHAQHIVMDETGLFFIYALTSPNKVDEVSRIMMTQIELLKNKPLLKSEFDIAQSQLDYHYLAGLESMAGRVNQMAHSMVMRQKAPDVDTKQSILYGLSPHDLQRRAKQVFRHAQIMVFKP